MSKFRDLNLKEIWYVASTFIGTIIGAGFASGQEILKFFTHFGPWSIVGILITCILFIVTGISVMYLGSKLQATSFGDVIWYVCGKRLGPLMDFLLGLFLFGTLSVMLAGAGAVFLQQWGLPYWLGTGITLILTMLTVLSGIKGIIRVNAMIVPFTILLCLLVTLPSISLDQLQHSLPDFIPAGHAAAPHWLLSTMLYVGYNITFSVSVLGPLGNEIRYKSSLFWGGIVGGAALGIMCMLINLAILSHYPAAAGYEVPSLFVAGRLAFVIQLAFSFVLWAEIFTTLVGDIFGLSARVTASTRLNYNLTAIVMMLIALGLSQFGFSGLLGVLYPSFGYISLLFIAALLLQPFLKRK